MWVGFKLIRNIVKCEYLGSFMEKRFVLFGVFVLLFGGVLAADDWGDINSEGGVVDEEEQIVASAEDALVPDSYEDDVSSDLGDGNFFTKDFYIALGVVGFVLVLIGIVLWFVIRGPKNKWEE